MKPIKKTVKTIFNPAEEWPFPTPGSDKYREAKTKSAGKKKAGGLAVSATDADKELPEKLAFTSGKNPAWSRDELILTMDLYLKNRAAPPSKISKEVIAMSELLNQAAAVLGNFESKTFRNANGVYMKMMNFRSIDPKYTDSGKVGLARGNKDEKVVWSMFINDQARLHQVAGAIREAIKASNKTTEASNVDNSSDGADAEEGKVLTRLHRFRERNRRLIEKRKQKAIKEHGRLHCEACSFDFSSVYGEAGNGIIEVHHTKPVHTLVEGDKTSLDDLILLCANCHRVVHRTAKWLTIEQLKAAVRSPD